MMGEIDKNGLLKYWDVLDGADYAEGDKGESQAGVSEVGAFHKKGSVVSLYVKWKDDGRGLISVHDCVKEEELGLFGYVEVSDEWMLKRSWRWEKLKSEHKKHVQKASKETF